MNTRAKNIRDAIEDTIIENGLTVEVLGYDEERRDLTIQSDYADFILLRMALKRLNITVNGK